MSEPAFIPSSEPFKVSMPEGSTVARSQSANVGDDVRRVLADEYTGLMQSSGGAKFAKRGNVSENASKKQHVNKPWAQAAALAADSTEEERLALIEMDFPARVVHLKIENDTVRKQINELNEKMQLGR